ncbi:MAG: hypothetical protein J7500_17215 [Sphingomonas sp.]|uniref:hypothetical protein n=1 Tax=Sphingomonas sp. TaxID=28214 RepID=UPI001AFE1B04|nr:hypothetical protein [Sphingomonas sp.]MBO9624451.1 hypothetical protein [Sphingomonas sp.]
MPNATEAREALDRIDASRAQLARAADCPPERHLAFAALMGGWALSPLAGNYQPLTLAPLLLALILIVQWDRRRMGMFVNGYRRGRTRYVIAALLLLIMPLYVASIYFARETQLVWPSVAAAGAMTVIAYVGSTIWQRVFRRELGLAR